MGRPEKMNTTGFGDGFFLFPSNCEHKASTIQNRNKGG